MEIRRNEGIVAATKGRCNRIYWGIFIVYLVAILIVQFAFIWKLHVQVDVLSHELEESYDKCSSVHKITKRYSQSLYCPPGCIRRRRRKGLFSAAGRQESTVQPYQAPGGYYGSAGQPGDRGWPGLPGESGEPGLAGGAGSPGAPGQPGWRGLPGGPGQQGQPGGQGHPGSMGGQGQPGNAGAPGSPGGPGLRGPPGDMGAPGERGSPGGRGPSGSPGMHGMPGERGAPGGHGSPGEPGSQGARGPSGSRGHPGSIGYSYHQHYGYNTEVETTTAEPTSAPVVKSGQTRGDQGAPTFDPNFALEPTTRKNETQMNEVLKELRLLDHPECKDDFDHQTLLDTFKEKGRVSFMILVDLQDSVYCIVHGKHEEKSS